MPTTPAPSPTPMTQGQSFNQLPMYDQIMGQGAQTSWNTNPLNNLIQAPNISVQDFMHSAPYQLQYGDNQALDPSQRFLNDPGVQMAIKAGTNDLQNAYSSKGLGASGAASAGLTQAMYKNYNDFTNQQQTLYGTQYDRQNEFLQNKAAGFLNQQNLTNSIYSNYQNQLGQIANLGSQTATGMGNMANSNQQNLSSIISQMTSNAGQQAGVWTTQAGQNAAQMLVNMGIFDANTWASVGAAMSNNMMSGSQLGAQLANAQNQSNSNSMSSMLQGNGAMNGAYGGGQ